MLDEPTAGVDPKARRDFWDEIRRLAATGVTVLVSTHYMDEAVQCDALAYIAYGKKLISGPARDIPRDGGADDLGGGGAVMWRRWRSSCGPSRRWCRSRGLARCCMCRAPIRWRWRRSRGRIGTGAQWAKLEGGLEEAFIYLMSGAQDNFAGVPT